MAGRSIALKLACVVVMCLLVAAPLTQVASQCNTVDSVVTTCLTDLKNGANIDGCCTGLKNVTASASSTATIETDCKCLKAILAGKSINVTEVVALLKRCEIKLPENISGIKC
ncbi:hypothetical protein CFOL_v3_19012 [Cephalotus follicularis]|uniref:Bifunctional inhibitor/plant lipid transfer protein/seed storage helical domain-containing protein n=1 Tax=Cephalotus follicularis TaxID=3775 RepID=A0A1Q3C630_CEPFO|nr:hypothetical protein CFOL_v3_19012 [Cephalotus follicularis]